MWTVSVSVNVKSAELPTYRVFSRRISAFSKNSLSLCDNLRGVWEVKINAAGV